MAYNAREEFSLFVLVLLIFRCFGDIDINTKLGVVTGRTFRYLGNKIYTFKGVPYGEITTQSRYRASQMVEPWSERYVATNLKPSCAGVKPTPLDNIYSPATDQTSEDCQYVNIYTPSVPGVPTEKASPDTISLERQKSGSPPYPVLVYFPNEVLGSTFQPFEIVSREKIVVVSINCRISQLGYLCLGEASNLALRDQQLALEWIQENIESFHGDKSRVTLLGVGDSAVDVNIHLLSTVPRLFKRVWISSKSTLSPQSLSRLPMVDINKFLASVGCADSSASSSLSCLRQLPLTTILAGGHKQTWRSCVDGKSLFRNPSSMYEGSRWRKDIDVVVGFPEFDQHVERKGKLIWAELIKTITDTLVDLDFGLAKVNKIIDDVLELYDEGLLSLEVLLARILTDMNVVTPLLRLADYHTIKPESNWGKVYAYEYTYRRVSKGTSEFITSTHGDDLTFMFGIPCIEMTNSTWYEADCIMSRDMMSRLASFMRSGKPNSDSSIFLWPEYSYATGNRKVFSIRDVSHCKTFTDFHQNKYEFWSKHLFGAEKLPYDPDSLAKTSVVDKDVQMNGGNDITTTQIPPTTTTAAAANERKSKTTSDSVVSDEKKKDEL